MILAIQSAIDPISIAIMDNDTLIDSQTFETGMGVIETLIDPINDLLKRNQKSLEDVNAIGVTNGPGGYTGLRLGISVAKTIAEVSKIPIIGIDCLEAIVSYFKTFDGCYFSVMPARPKEINTAMFGVVDSLFVRVSENMTISIDDAIAMLKSFDETIVAVGHIPDALKLGLEGENNVRIRNFQLTADIVAQYTQVLLDNGVSDQIDSLTPNYSHPPTSKPQNHAQIS